ncbi:prolyl oligopeptidase family serine peptidase [Telmatospirillum sp.]|uniref:prolyl oligopeptidase family serine peptidase n=1 Tax=Telmatospirillum sp. TaxID=2079197 RepID=UPI00284937F7|nr:prolyl oligopeptidase family serine peptidase [Telmatospirillum sp.]MDR3435843.1 prolyl oligopeptidase family serine peptidase [Telmatospirillum sp.]
MPSRVAYAVCLLFLFLWSAADSAQAGCPLGSIDHRQGGSYPAAARGGQLDVFHGVSVADPYRWMEAIDEPETRDWVKAEAKLSAACLAAIPERNGIARRLKTLWNFERWSAPVQHGANWFFSHNDGLQNQSMLFVAPTLEAGPRLLLDPNGLSKDGTVALRELAISDDGTRLAYALSEAGSDWQTWHVRDVATGRDLPDQIHWSKAGSASWLKDGSGFYYTAYDRPQEGAALKERNVYQKLYLHKLGTAQSADRLIYGRSDDPDWFVGGQVSDDGRFLVIQANHGDDVRNTLLVEGLSAPATAIQTVIGEPDASYTFIGNVGGTLYVLTDREAPRYRIIAIDLGRPQPENWRTIVAESDETLESAGLVGGQVVAKYLKDAHSAVVRFALDGKRLGDVGLPGLGTASGFDGQLASSETTFVFSSYTQPPSVYRLDLSTGKTAVWRAPKLAGFDPAAFETRQVFASSKDGTKVPIFLVARRGVALDGSNPTILYGYGGFNISLEPQFSPSIAGWLDMGGVYAVATLRGGGEYGRAWHEAGMKTHKQNVFDDFIAAASYLIDEKWTSPSRLAILGGSNGGLLVGAVLEQRPELFAAAVPEVGVMDMLRFREFTIGKGWESDYGSVDDPEEFKALLAYSPVHNVKSGVDYPATLVITGDHDDRVFPAHSFKFAAAMQNANPDGKPVLIRIETRAGHGQGKPTAKRIAETADVFAFIRQSFGLAAARRLERRE